MNTVLDISAIKKCLHDKKCSHLSSSYGKRPVCAVTLTPVFDLPECPKGKWWTPPEFKKKGEK